MLGGQQQHGDPIHLNAHPPPINAGRGAHSGGFWSSRFMQTVRLNLKWVMILGILLLVAYALFTPSKSTNTIADAVSSASGSSSSTRGATMSPTHPGKLQPPLGSKPVLAASGSSNHSPRPKSNGKKNGNTNKQDATKQSPSSASKLIAASTSPPVFAGLSPNIPKRAPPQPRCSDVCLATDYTGSRFRECLRQACMPRDVLTRKPLSYAAARSMLYTFVNNPAALALSEPTPYAPKDAPVAATGSNPAASNSNNNNNNNDEPAAGAAVAAGLYAGSSAASTADAANADVTATAVTDSIVGGGGGSGGHLTCVYGGYTIPYPALQENVALELLKQLQPEKRRRRSKRDRDGGRRGNRQSRRGRRRHKSDTASSSSADADDVYRAVEETKESPSSSSMMQVQMPDPINCEHTLPQSAFRWPCQRPRSPAAATSTGEEGMDEVKENTMANDDSNVNSNSLRRRGRGRGRGGRHGRGHDRGRGRGRGGRCRRGKVERRLQSDLHHMFPAHAELNRERGNLPFGELDEVKLLQKERQQLAAREKEREEEEQEERRRNSNTRRRQRRGHGRGRRRDYIDEYDMEIMEAEKDKKNPAARAATAASVTSSVTPGDGTVTDSTSSTSSLATCPVDLRWYRESEEQEPPPDSKTWGVYSKRDGNVGTWEPPEQHKGAVVRSLAYMYTMYENELMAVARAWRDVHLKKHKERARRRAERDRKRKEQEEQKELNQQGDGDNDGNRRRRRRRRSRHDPLPRNRGRHGGRNDRRSRRGRRSSHNKCRPRHPRVLTGTIIDFIPSTLISAWHSADPATVAERVRNVKVRAVQGNVNPFIDDARLMERAFPVSELVPQERERELSQTQISGGHNDDLS